MYLLFLCTEILLISFTSRAHYLTANYQVYKGIMHGLSYSTLNPQFSFNILAEFSQSVRVSHPIKQ